MSENEKRTTQALTEEDLDKAAGGADERQDHPVTKVDGNYPGCDKWMADALKSLFQVIKDKKNPRCGNCACFSAGNCSMCVVR